MSNSDSDLDAATEHTALMDGHIAEARPDREIAERIARKRKTKAENQRTYGVSTITLHVKRKQIYIFILSFAFSSESQISHIILHAI